MLSVSIPLILASMGTLSYTALSSIAHLCCNCMDTRPHSLPSIIVYEKLRDKQLTVIRDPTGSVTTAHLFLRISRLSASCCGRSSLLNLCLPTQNSPPVLSCLFLARTFRTRRIGEPVTTALNKHILLARCTFHLSPHPVETPQSREMQPALAPRTNASVCQHSSYSSMSGP